MPGLWLQKGDSLSQQGVRAADRRLTNHSLDYKHKAKRDPKALHPKSLPPFMHLHQEALCLQISPNGTTNWDRVFTHPAKGDAYHSNCNSG